jgi:hypothetical protein
MLSEIKLLASVCGREGVLLAFLLASLLTIQCIIRWLVVWRLLKIAIEKSAPENLHKVVESGASLLRSGKTGGTGPRP